LPGDGREGRAPRTLQEANWENARVVGDLEAACAALKAALGRDILALSSASVIQACRTRTSSTTCGSPSSPAIIHGGLRLLPDRLPASRWEL
jgi:hypothetical protein